MIVSLDFAGVNTLAQAHEYMAQKLGFAPDAPRDRMAIEDSIFTEESGLIAFEIENTDHIEKDGNDELCSFINDLELFSLEAVKDEVLADLTYWEEGDFPAESVDFVNNHPEIFEPILLQALDELIEDLNNKVDDSQSDLYISAILTLSKYQNAAAFDKITQILALISTRDLSAEIFGDFLTGNMSSALAATYNGNFEMLKSLVLNQNLYLFVRTSGIEALKILHHLGKVKAEEIISILEQVIIEEAAHEYDVSDISIFLDALAAYSIDLAERLISDHDIQTDPMFYSPDLDEQNWAESVEMRTYETVVSSGMYELKSWAFFQTKKEIERPSLSTDLFNLAPRRSPIPSAPKIGRNDPCTCGSGKKYKKCCLNAAEAA